MSSRDLTREDVERRVRTVIAEELGVELSDIEPRARLVEDLGADSLDVLDLRGTLEDEFGVPMDGRGVAGMETVGAIVDQIARELGVRAPAATGQPA